MGPRLGKRLLFWVPLFLLFLLALPLAAHAATQVEVTGLVVNLRAGPGTDYPVVGQVSRGTRLVVVGEARGWYNVALPDGRRAFIAGWLARPLEEAVPSRGITAREDKPVSSPAAPPNSVEVTGSVVNLRAGPGTDYPVVGQVSRGTRLVVVGEARGWYNVVLPDGRRAFIAGWLARPREEAISSRGGEERLIPSALAGKKIALDPGHGGSDPGAIGPTGYQEKGFTLAVARLLAAELRSRGAQVLLTRDRDVDVGLYARAAMANDWGADVFLSIHADASFNSSARGISTWYRREGATAEDRRLAQCLQEALVKELGLADRGLFTANFVVLRESSMPAALVEIGFISNSDEEALLRTPEFQARAAKALVDGLERYFSS
ncbi:N-acetylmuramoyl-L-alanine amidase [Ammonifex degensii KC4]|uniref:N-acetylmuramoyl-L-alanine amidase n=1 Tax=Ammonifex degensii (strain DSM 10501 / KC4) TaxID=429009 RepID=C9RBK1_AMMDK|nr:N-acetylmuramoyl-L-alanine amidase [Ammonifex degensii]ACX51628.1 N-acetylmuramoyl-L-alanine amidase [Ammonifex degensii KC4]